MSNSVLRVGDFAYDVALSFAGEQRACVEKVAVALRRRGIRPFYDDYGKVNLWGKDLHEHLGWIYRKAVRYRVLFVSEDYAKKVWTTHERRSAQARALQSNQEYVLPVRFDDAASGAAVDRWVRRRAVTTTGETSRVSLPVLCNNVL